MNEICVVFPGEGSQYFGMAKAIYDKYDEAKELFTEAEKLLGYSLADVIFNVDTKMMAKQEVLQPAVFVSSCAFYKTLCKRTDANPTHFTGYGVGSISALFCAGAISFSDGVKLAQKRGKALDKSFKDKDYLVAQINWKKQGDITKWVEELDPSLSIKIVAFISSNCCVVCMPSSHKRVIIQECKKNEVSMKFLPNDVPVGCQIAEKCAPLFEECCNEIHIKKLFKKVYSLLDGSVYSASLFGSKKNVVRNLVKELYNPASFKLAVESIVADGVNKFVDIGPSRICSEWIRELDMPSVRISIADWEENPFFSVDFFEEKKLFNKNFLMVKMLTAALSIQNSCFDDELYEKGVLQPYKSMKERYDHCVSESREPKEVEIKQQKEDLTRIMKTKGLTANEIEDHLKDIENETLLLFI